MDIIDDNYIGSDGSLIQTEKKPAFTRGLAPKKAMSIGLNLPPKEKDIPFYERREYWHSPLAIFLILGFGIAIIGYGLFFIFKWILLTPIRPFTDVKWLCKDEIDLHKYRKIKENKWDAKTYYKCRICNKEKIVDNS